MSSIPTAAPGPLRVRSTLTVRVADILTAAIQGLQGIHYLDQTDERVERVETADAVHVPDETDRIYLNAPELSSWCLTHRVRLKFAKRDLLILWSGIRGTRARRLGI